ncbi:maleate cis-trans isomerase family protein [Rubrimonas cliftonensis]|uniref:Maleate isomerase n=1 Tax=Rubrimonas cliftonensis TaxID=89524 RepID=A0A1H4CLZ9_9RHOB|nr:Asp/Glu racemase [Rubrimonas cliftonensis]SEA61475.1 maleate isomerase [Rubrimonas cliftonensis]
MARFPYALTGPIGARATLGLIVLRVDETIEHDLRRLFAARDVALHVSRVPSGDDLTPDSIARMEAAPPAAAALLPPAARFDAIGYGCTSGATLIGSARVAALVSGAAATRHVVDPLAAALAAFRALGVGSVAVVSPYIDAVAEPVRAALRDAGLRTPACLSFGEEVEARVARIDPASIRAAALAAGAARDVEAVFVSCTNLRALDVIDDLEAELGKPVVASNQALAWEMARRSGALPLSETPGRLLRLAH